MASELSQLIESELRKAEGANKPDEHQRRLASLRVKTGLERPPPTLFQRVCTTKRQIIAGAVVTVLLLVLIVYAAASHRHSSASPDSLGYAQLHDQPRGTVATTARPSIPDTQESIEPGTPDHLETSTGVTEHSEDTVSTADEPDAQDNFAVISSSVDDFDRPEAESQAHKQAISSNFINEGAPAEAPAVLQIGQSIEPSMAPTISSQNFTAALAPSPDTSV